MIIRVLTFSKQARKTANEFFEGQKDFLPIHFDDYFKENSNEGCNDCELPNDEYANRKKEARNLFIKEAFFYHEAILFVGAIGIAVRHIAPFVSDKSADSPVLVLDEKGLYIIPILSGHLGGANEIAMALSNATSKAIITTATDLEGVFSVDSFAKKMGFYLPDKKGILPLSKASLEGRGLDVKIDSEFSYNISDLPSNFRLVDDSDDIADLWIHSSCEKNSHLNSRGTHLYFQPYIVGMGSKKGKTFDELLAFYEECLEACGIKKEEVFFLASIDLKKEEIGLLRLASYHQMKFVTYSSDELQDLVGDFYESDYVKSVTGVSNVCQRAALLGAKQYSQNKEKARLVSKRIARDGMTFAVAKREACILKGKFYGK